MNKLLHAVLLSALASTASAQLSSNPDKFLGNITTSYQVDYGNEKYYTLWNQITPENESKWGSVEGSRGRFNWGCDAAFNYAKQHNFTYKFHALVWGAQYPNWLPALPVNDRYKAIDNWMSKVKAKYNTLPLIDVVNEAVGQHQAGNPMMKESLGGGGKTGYDWLIKAFDMAGERWPDAILIYNDYNTFQWDTDNYIKLVQALRDNGAPIDAYGCQSHDLTDINFTNFKNVMAKIQNALKMPMYSTEYDIGTSDDNKQLTQYKNQIPYMWEQDYVAGITLWGYIYGHTWTTDGNSGIIRNGKDRPAMEWLREYMKSDKAKNAKSPFPGMKKQVSVYIRPRSPKMVKGDTQQVLVRTHITDKTKTIEKVELYDGTTLLSTMTEAPYLVDYTPTSTGMRTLKAVVTCTDGAVFERIARVNVTTGAARKPYNDVMAVLPGVVEAEAFDTGVSGDAFSGVTRSTTSTAIVAKDNAWMEYTVDVKEDGIYAFDAEVASANANGLFHIAEYGLERLDYLSDFISVPKTGDASTYQPLHAKLNMPLKAGRHILCLCIDKGGFNIDKLTFTRYEENKSIMVSVPSVKPTTLAVDDQATVTVTATCSNSTVASVSLYANNLLVGTKTEAPYEFDFTPTTMGTYTLMAIVTDADGKQKTSSVRNQKVNGRRIPYAGKDQPIEIPGILEAENYDVGGEKFTYHDTNEKNEGDAAFRTSDGVDIVNGNGGKAVGYTEENEWMEYSVEVKEDGEYECTATVSSGVTGSSFLLGRVNATGSVTNLGTFNVPQTGSNSWDTYQTVTVKLLQKLTAGKQTFRITIKGKQCNIDKLELKNLTTGVNEVVFDQSVSDHSGYNLSGQRVNGNYRGLIIRNGRKEIKR